jgi:hypothetical protein
MKLYKKYEATVNMNCLSGYSTLSAILIAILLMFSVLAPAMANESSLAGKIILQEDTGEAALSPRPKFTPDKVVCIQLDALANNDRPYQDAGIEIAFRFASPTNKQTTGPLSRFIRLVHNPIYNPMIDHQTAQLGDLVVEDAQAFLPVSLTASDGKRVGYMFILSKQEGGAYDQCWMTDAVLRFKIKSAGWSVHL